MSDLRFQILEILVALWIHHHRVQRAKVKKSRISGFQLPRKFEKLDLQSKSISLDSRKNAPSVGR